MDVSSNNISKEDQLSFIEKLKAASSESVTTEGYDDKDAEKEKDTGSSKDCEQQHIVEIGTLRIIFEGSKKKSEQKLFCDLKRSRSELLSEIDPQEFVIVPKENTNKYNLKGVYNRETKCVDVTWDPLPGRSSENDSITLCIYNREFDGSYYSVFHVKNCPPGKASCSISAPQKGFCELRYFEIQAYWSMKNCHVSRSDRILIGEEVKLIGEVNENSGMVNVLWEELPASSKGASDWIGLYNVEEQSNGKFKVWNYASKGKSEIRNGREYKILSFNRPREPGTYEFRFFFGCATGTFGKFCSGYSNQIGIANESILAVEVSGDEKSFYVKYCCPSSEPTNKDYIGIYKSPGSEECLGRENCLDKGRNKVLNSGSVLFEGLLGKYTTKERENWEIRFISMSKVVAKIPFVSKK